MSGSRLDVLSVGELNPDLIVSGLRAPAPVLGTEQEFDTQTLVLGSATAIATVLMSRLGLATALVSRTGDDEHGRFCLDRLLADGVEPHVVLDARARTGLTISLTYPSDRLLLTAPGTMAEMSVADVPPGLMERARHLHVSSFYLQPKLAPGLAYLFATARATGLSTSLDTGFDPAERWMTEDLEAVLPAVDIFLPNEVELRGLTGIDDPERAARSLLARGVGRVAAKRGPDGGLLVGGGETLAVGSPRIDVVDTTGAGDAFNAGFLFGQLSGFDAATSLRWATACGAMTAAALGGTGGFRSAAAVRDFMASYGTAA